MEAVHNSTQPSAAEERQKQRNLKLYVDLSLEAFVEKCKKHEDKPEELPF